MRDLNFFSFSKDESKEKVNQKLNIYVILILVLSIILITFCINTIKIYRLNKDIKHYTQELENPDMKRQFEEAENINKNLELLNKYNDGLEEILSEVTERDNVSDILLNDINGTVPNGINFEKLTIQNDSVKISGVSQDRTSVAELKHNLSSLSNMKYVHISRIDENGATNGKYAFNIECILKDVE